MAGISELKSGPPHNERVEDIPSRAAASVQGFVGFEPVHIVPRGAVQFVPYANNFFKPSLSGAELPRIDSSVV